MTGPGRRSRAAARRSIRRTASAASSARRSTTAGRRRGRPRPTTRRRRSRPSCASSRRARSSRATIRRTSRSRSRSIRTRAASTAASTATRGRRMPISISRRASTSRRSSSRSRMRRSCSRRAREAGLRRAIPIALGTNTDPYQPIEREWKITRRVIEVLAACDHPLTITTKGALIERDLDLLAPMAAKNLVRVFISIAMLDRELARTLDPRAAAPQRRLEIVKALREAGIPVGVNVAPVIPQLTDKDLESILEAAAAAGATPRRVDAAAAAARGGAAVPRVARRALSAARRARDEHRAAHPRRPRQRPALRRADARPGRCTPI